MITRLQQNKTSTTKNTKVSVPGGPRVETLYRTDTLKSSRRLHIDKICSCRNSLSPELWWNMRGKEKSAGSLNQMMIFALSNPILSIDTRTRRLVKSALLRKKLSKSARTVLASRIIAKSTDGRIKLSTNHCCKATIDHKKLTTIRHRENPCKTRIIINEDHIKFMPSFRDNRRRSPYI